MALLTGIFSDVLQEQTQRRAAERRSSLENPQTPLSFPAEWLLDMFNGGRTDSGIRVSELTAFQVITFLTCVDLVAGSIAALPLHVYERSFLKPTGRAIHKVAYDHELYDLLNSEPNDEMSRFTFIKALMAHILAWGNGYAELQRDGANSVVGVWPRNPAKTRPYRISEAVRLDPAPWRPFPVNLTAGSLVYQTTDAVDTQDQSDPDASAWRSARIIPAEDMMHVPGLALDGRVGQSTVWLARQTLGLALATEKYGAKYFANYAKPGGILELPANMTPEARDKAKQSWMEAQGGENAHRAAVMPAGFKWTPTSNNPEEAQTTQTRGYVRNEICALMHVPPHMVGDVDKGKSNTEQMAQEYVSYALSPWLTALKQEFKRKLFPNSGIGRTPKNRFFVDFDLHDMLRPDAASREKYYATGRQWGFLNTNMILELEKLNPVDEPWAEKYWMPINMTLTDTPLDPTNQDGAGNGEPAPADAIPGKGDKAPEAKPNGKDKGSADTARLIAAYSRLFEDSFKRILARPTPDLRDFQQAFGPVLWSIADLFQRETGRELGQDCDRFIADYIGGMHKRHRQWATAGAAAPELDRAIRALRIAVYREAATQEALELSERSSTQ